MLDHDDGGYVVGQFYVVASHIPAVGTVSMLGVFSCLLWWFCGLVIWD